MTINGWGEEPDPRAPRLPALAHLLAALAEPARLSLLRHLTLGEHRVVELTAHLGLAQSTTSAHLARLRECGLVSVRSDGRASVYALVAPAELDALLAAAEALRAATAPGENHP
ncbi:MAG: metalloregulator ArsR/SmtB family transcription factor [Propionibacteriaceae bacterium]|nr:metalloregulator ArsR/SmtB family transcription factor [Propionibacteriaceae bacterium]